MNGKFIPAAHFNFLTPYYEAISRPFAFRIWKRIADEVIGRAPQNGTVLDLGCGPGTILRFVREKRPDLKLIGIDIDPDVIRVAEQKTQNMNIRFQVASIDQVPFPERSADIVISSLMFHHLDESMKQKALQEIRRILKPRGFFFLCDFSIPKYKWIKYLAYPILVWEHEANKQLGGQLKKLAVEAGMDTKTLTSFLACIALLECTSSTNANI